MSAQESNGSSIGSDDSTEERIELKSDADDGTTTIVIKKDGSEDASSVVDEDESLTKMTTKRRIHRFLKGTDAAPPMSIEFSQISAYVDVMDAKGHKTNEKKRILHSVKGKCSPGELCALMGPSGAGKSTLLNVLGSRFEGSHSGIVKLNGQPRTKRFKKFVGYVLQSELPLPNLTVRETLEVTAALRLPEDMPKFKKKERVDDIIEIMGLGSCVNTKVQLCSGGEKKRVSIANEMLINPSILFLDEPTSGLDSTSAFSILATLKELTASGRTVICAIHQPSSQMYQKFDKLMLLASGHVIYEGVASEAINYFSSVGYICPNYFNPADFILELITDAFESENELFKDKKKIKEKLTKTWKDRGDSVIKSQESIVAAKSSATLRRIEIDSAALESEIQSTPPKMNGDRIKSKSVMSVDFYGRDVGESQQQKWATGWITQFIVLAGRALKHRRGHIITKVKAVEICSVALVGGLIYLKMAKTERNAGDIVGAAFFIQIYISFMVMYRGIVYFPTERSVVKKERQSGAYRLSSYFLSKIVSEWPIDCFLPLVAVTIYFWMSGFGNFVTYLLFLLATTVGIWAANSYGTFLGCALMDFERCLTALTVTGIGMMLLGGFYAKERVIPDWIGWLGALSHFKWTYYLTAAIILEDMSFRCANPSQFEECEDGSVSRISGIDMLRDFGTKTSKGESALALICLSIGWNIAAYLFLRKNTTIPEQMNPPEMDESADKEDDDGGADAKKNASNQVSDAPLEA